MATGLDEMGFLPGWGSTVGRARENFQMLLDIIQVSLEVRLLILHVSGSPQAMRLLSLELCLSVPVKRIIALPQHRPVSDRPIPSLATGAGPRLGDPGALPGAAAAHV